VLHRAGLSSGGQMAGPGVEAVAYVCATCWRYHTVALETGLIANSRRRCIVTCNLDSSVPQYEALGGPLEACQLARFQLAIGRLRLQPQHSCPTAAVHCTRCHRMACVQVATAVLSTCECYAWHATLGLF
jgi:hypothetical protein